MLANQMEPSAIWWLEVASAQGYPRSDREVEMVRTDAGQHRGCTRLVAQRIEG